jgi:hypothetical protein
MPDSQLPHDGKPRRDTYSRKRPALVGVRLSPDELATLQTVALREGKSLPSALRDGFLRHAASDAD